MRNRLDAPRTTLLLGIKGVLLGAQDMCALAGASTSKNASPDADSYKVDFATNHGGALPEGQVQPGDLVRISATSCKDRPASAPDYGLYFVEGKVHAVLRRSERSQLAVAHVDAHYRSHTTDTAMQVLQ